MNSSRLGYIQLIGIWWYLANNCEGSKPFQSHWRVGLAVCICWAANQTWDLSCPFSAGIHPWYAPSSCIAWLNLISTPRCSWHYGIAAWTWWASGLWWSCSFVDSPENDIHRSASCTATNKVHLIVSDIPLSAANSRIGNHLTQSSCWWFTNMLWYRSMHAFIRSVWPSCLGWNAVDNLRSIPRWLHILPQKDDANWGPQSETIVNASPWRRTTSVTNNLANQEVSTIELQRIQCRIFESQSTATNIASNLSHSGNPTTKFIAISSPRLFLIGKSQRTPKVECWELQDWWHPCQHRT